MTILAQDTFIRANQSGWGTASDGESWSSSGASSTQSITSNEGVIAATGGSDTHNQLGTQTADDQDILCRIAINNASDVTGIQARFSTSGGFTAYKLLYYSNDLHINKVYLGTNTPLVSYGGYTLTLGTFYWFRLRCVGNSIAAMIWPDGGASPPNWLMALTDVSIPSGGFAVLANSNSGIGIKFDHFSVSTIVPAMHEIALALGWIVSTLSADIPLQGYAPGGVWRAEAPPGTATPYVIIAHQPGQSKDEIVFGGARAYSDLCFQVIATGPAANGETIANAAVRIDSLLTVSQSTAVTGGTIITSYRTQPVEADTIINGETWTDMGGIYRIMCKGS